MATTLAETRIREQHLRDLNRFIKASDIRRFKVLLATIKAAYPELINESLDINGNRAVHLTIEEAFDEGLEVLLETGESNLDLNAVNEAGETMLHVAVNRGFSVIVERLLDCEGLNLGARTKLRKDTALHLAARMGDLESLNLLIKAGLQLAEKDADGNTPLHVAVACRKTDIVRELMKCGADSKLKNNQMKTPIYIAMKELNSPEINQMLIQQQRAPGPTGQPVLRGGSQRISSRVDGPTRRPTKWIAPNRNGNAFKRTTFPPPTDNRPGGVSTSSSNQLAVPKRGTFFTSALNTPNDASPALTPKLGQVDANQLKVEIELLQQRRRADLKSAGCQVDMASEQPSNNPVKPEHTGPVYNGSRRKSDFHNDRDDPGSYYKMRRNPHGICLIINNVSFFHDNFQNRQGADVDERRLESVFQNLGYIVKLHKNLTATEMFWIVTNIAQQNDHSNFDSFICCILSHGALGTIYDINGESLKITDLTVALTATHCPSLAGKPKMFFIQACRGEEIETGVVCPDNDHDAVVGVESVARMVPKHADFLLSYATVAGYRAQRNKTEGSIYLRHLCACMESDAEWSDVLSILVKVNGKVSQEILRSPDGFIYKQMPEVRHTLTKKIAFK